MLYTLCIIIAQIQILHYYIVYIMYHCITDALFFISSILPYNKISRKKSVQFDADEEVQMDSFIFTLRLKLLSQPRLHHFLLVIWKLLRNRFPDFLSTQAQLSEPTFSWFRERRVQNKRARLPFAKKCEFVIFQNWTVSCERRWWNRIEQIKEMSLNWDVLKM